MKASLIIQLYLLLMIGCLLKRAVGLAVHSLTSPISTKRPIRHRTYTARFVSSNPSSTSRDILALDFDGVMCHSSPESSVSAVIACDKLWGYEMTDKEKEAVKGHLMQLRPIVETGYENMLLARLAIEEIRLSGAFDAQLILSIWGPQIRDALLQKFDCKKENLIAYFGDTRDSFIKEDFNKWISLNSVFDCVKKTFDEMEEKPNMANYFIITTKQERFVRAILERNNISCPPNDRLFGLENKIGSKPEILKMLVEKFPNQRLHFIEDRVETLEKVASMPELDDVQLYLAKWGYVTEEQLKVAGKLQNRIEIINEDRFAKICNLCL